MDLSPSEYPQCPLQFYDFKHLDHTKSCTVYTSVCTSQGNNTLSLTDLETLHTDLSKLKEAVQNRIQLLSSELTVLGDWHIKRKRKHSDSDSTSNTASKGQKSSHHQSSSSKSHNKSQSKNTTSINNDDQYINTSLSNNTATTTTTGVQGPPSKKLKGKSNKSDIISTDPNIIGSTVSALTKSKTEGADKFWASLEPYFTDITETDLHSLQSQDNYFDKSLFEIPTLGKHYSHQWSMEDLMEEGHETSRIFPSSNNKRKGSWQDDAIHLITDNTTTTTASTRQEQYGPLTQKLIATFLDTPNGSSTINTTLPNKVAETISTELTPAVLEKRLKDELTSLGIIEPIEVQDNLEEEDEIVRELKKAQAELKTVHEYNQQQKRMLHSLAKSEMRRQDIRKQLQETDKEIMEWLKHFATYRKRRKEPIKPKERESAQRCLEKRQKLIQHLLV